MMSHEQDTSQPSPISVALHSHLDAFAQRYGYADFEAVKAENLNDAWQCATYSVKDTAKEFGVSRMDVWGQLLDLTDEDREDPILDDDAPVGERITAMLRFTDRHPKLASDTNEQDGFRINKR